LPPSSEKEEKGSLRIFRPGGLRDRMTKKFDSIFGTDVNHSLQSTTTQPSTSPPNNELKPVKRNSQEGDGSDSIF